MVLDRAESNLAFPMPSVLAQNWEESKTSEFHQPFHINVSLLIRNQ